MDHAARAIRAGIEVPGSATDLEAGVADDAVRRRRRSRRVGRWCRSRFRLWWMDLDLDQTTQPAIAADVDEGEADVACLDRDAQRLPASDCRIPRPADLGPRH